MKAVREKDRWKCRGKIKDTNYIVCAGHQVQEKQEQEYCRWILTVGVDMKCSRSNLEGRVCE